MWDLYKSLQGAFNEMKEEKDAVQPDKTREKEEAMGEPAEVKDEIKKIEMPDTKVTGVKDVSEDPKEQGK